MCERCRLPSADRPHAGLCSRCGRFGTFWLIQYRVRLPERICAACIYRALLAAA